MNKEKYVVEFVHYESGLPCCHFEVLTKGANEGDVLKKLEMAENYAHFKRERNGIWENQEIAESLNDLKFDEHFREMEKFALDYYENEKNFPYKERAEEMFKYYLEKFCNFEVNKIRITPDFRVAHYGFIR